MKRCQMFGKHMGTYGAGGESFCCNKPAKYRVPEIKMGVEFVCGMHARSLNMFYKRIGSTLVCLKLEGEGK